VALAVRTGRSVLWNARQRSSQVKPAIGDDPARLLFNVGDDFFVADLEQASCGQHAPPMRHQLLVTPVGGALVIASEAKQSSASVEHSIASSLRSSPMEAPGHV
jgi:hypothetical protein